MLAAVDAPLRSLAVSEPPAFGPALGDPVVDAYVAEVESFLGRAHARGVRARIPRTGRCVPLSGRLSPTLEQGARAAMAERPPWLARIPVTALRRAPFAKLVVSGAHHPAYDAVCDALERGLGAERAVLPGGGHNIPRAPGYNDVLAAFLDRAEQAS